jgi:hypothetical protein
MTTPGIDTPLASLEAALVEICPRYSTQPRLAAIQSVKAVASFLDQVGLHDKGLTVPLTATIAALEDLDAGTVSEIVRPATIEGRPRNPSMPQGAQAIAVHAVELLLTKRMPIDQACRKVGWEMRQAGYQFKGSRSDAQIIKGWIYGLSRLRRRAEPPQIVRTYEGVAIEIRGIPYKRLNEAQLWAQMKPLIREAVAEVFSPSGKALSSN